MLTKILQTHYTFAPWEEACPRFKRLRYLDLWLQGKFYDPMRYAFCEEQAGDDRLLSIRERRPAVQHNLPRMIANITARKLFGGRHAPRIIHENIPFKKKVQALTEELALNSHMLEIVRRGSIGSVLVTFKFANVGDQVKSVIEIFKSFLVTPDFDEFNELVGAMIHYTTPGKFLMKMKFAKDVLGKPMKANDSYWFVKTINSSMEQIYMPIPAGKWNPVTGDDEKYLHPSADHAVPNPLQFLPCVWIKNLPGGEGVDGESTYESSLNNFIEYDYIYSQTGRGLLYSAAPQVVIKGDVINSSEGPDGTIHRGPTNILQLATDVKDNMGNTFSGSDAKLLETNGAGLKVSMEFCEKLKHNSLEQDSVARKDVESIKGVMSGKAMELIDQEFLDLVQELRVQYCQHGYLPLLKRICKAAALMGHPLMSGATDEVIDGITLQYPADYTLAPQELLFVVQALDIAVNGSHPPSQPKAGGEGTPAPAPVKMEPLMTAEEASTYLKTQMDFYIDSEDQTTIVETVDKPVGTEDDTLKTPPAELEPVDGSGTEPGGLDAVHPVGKSEKSVSAGNMPF